MSNKIIPMPMACTGRNALNEFLPERLFATDARGDAADATAWALHVPPEEVQLDPVEAPSRDGAGAPATVQVWPMLAAAFVALGTSLLALAVVARFGVTLP